MRIVNRHPRVCRVVTHFKRLVELGANGRKSRWYQQDCWHGADRFTISIHQVVVSYFGFGETIDRKSCIRSGDEVLISSNEEGRVIHERGPEYIVDLQARSPAQFPWHGGSPSALAQWRRLSSVVTAAS
ncbi:MAG: hypothetical protein ACK6AT_15970 [Planctomycetota bacterium]